MRMASGQELSSNAIHDALAETYGYDTDRTFASRLKVELLHRHLGPGKRVLDAGCANGLHIRLAAPRCAYAIGVDINESMLALARRRLADEDIRNARVELASVTELPFEPASFDVVYSFSTLLLVPDIDLAIHELARVLKPGGTAVLDITGRWNLSQRHWRRWYRENGHFGLHALRFPYARRLLELHGLVLEEAHALGLADQWKYLPLVGRVGVSSGIPDRILHGDAGDLDYRISNLPGLFRMANRWYMVCRRQSLV